MAEGNGSDVADNMPALNAMVQYTKDFSFENPNAPRSLGPQSQAPNIAIQVNVNVRQMAETDFEVELLLEGSAADGTDVLFKFELNYAGLFSAHQHSAKRNASDRHDRMSPPAVSFARQIVAEAVRSGGFPPLYIDPIDFAGLYRRRLEEMAAQQDEGAPIASA